MLAAVWITLAFLVLVLVAGTVHVVREGLRTWRTVKRTMRIAGAGADALTARADAAARKAGEAGSAAERLSAATAHLSRSLAYARVLADAAGDVRATVTGLRGSVPRK
ncbi:MAG TPA: hypothetical protein VLN26_13210 [Gaiellaceae bacterium]|nr:hypothetical protein [Gaiellaceae bacterium]